MRSNSSQTIKISALQEQEEDEKKNKSAGDSSAKTPDVIILHRDGRSDKMGIRSSARHCLSRFAQICMRLPLHSNRDHEYNSFLLSFHVHWARRCHAIAAFSCIRSHMRFVCCVSIVAARSLAFCCCCCVKMFLARFCAFSINLCNLF